VQSALETLRDLELFQGLSDAHRRAVAAVATDRRVPAGEIIFRRGDHADALFVVKHGRVDLTFPLQVMGEAREVRFQSLDAGRTLGWSALVPPNLLTMSARATTETELVVLPGDRLLAVLAAQPTIGHVVMANLAAVVATRFHELQALWVRELQRKVPQAPA
jgi:CRP/FNR family transcriptional regulator, cyclic AMP receptor protein